MSEQEKKTKTKNDKKYMCPYCGQTYADNYSQGCCGESGAHFEKLDGSELLDEDGEWLDLEDM